MKTEAKLYVAQITTEDGPDWDMFTFEGPINEARTKAYEEFQETYANPDMTVELFDMSTVNGYKVELHK